MESFEIVDFKSLEEGEQQLLSSAAEARGRAYCPYSKFAVGAAVRADDGALFAGCNVENAALSPSLCAERCAVAAAVAAGRRRLAAVAVVAQQRSITAPCGVCRQTLLEFPPAEGRLRVLLARPDLTSVALTTLDRILPLSFVSYTEDDGT